VPVQLNNEIDDAIVLACICSGIQFDKSRDPKYFCILIQTKKVQTSY